MAMVSRRGQTNADPEPVDSTGPTFNADSDVIEVCEIVDSMNQRKSSVEAVVVPVEFEDLTDVDHIKNEDEFRADRVLWRRWRRQVYLGVAAAVILGWWICTLVLRPPGYGWIVQTVLCWVCLSLIMLRVFSVQRITVAFARYWTTFLRDPWFRIAYKARLAFGCLALLAIFLGVILGLPDDPEYGSTRLTRARPVLAVFVFQAIFWATSERRSRILWPTVVIGLILQQLVALFVLKAKAGFDIFNWIVTVVEEFFSYTIAGKLFMWDAETVQKEWFIINISTAVLFFMGFVEMLYYLGVVQWLLKKLAWFFFKLMNISGAEATVAVASPVLGQGDSFVLVKPYVKLMTKSELHLVLTSGYSTISGSFIPVYVALGVPLHNLITSSVMSIPASIAISKMRCPETEEPVTRGSIVIDRGAEEDRPVNILHAFSKGAVFGLMIVGQIVANTLVFLSLLSLLNGLLTWVGQGFGIHQLTIQLILSYIFYPLSYLIGIPRREVLAVSRLLATKLVSNEIMAYTELQKLMATDEALSLRAFTITTYALCGFANLSSLSVTGVLFAIAPARSKTVARIAFSALFCGYLSTMQTAAIAGMML